jgi:putative transposon-encoded protein
MFFEDEPYTDEDVRNAESILKNMVNDYDGLVWQFGSVSEVTVDKEVIGAIRTVIKVMRDYEDYEKEG